MFQICDYCGDSHIFQCCHKGIQLIRFMKNKESLEKCSMVELRWLCSYYNKKKSNKKKSMIGELIQLNKMENLYECPICYLHMDLDKTVITPCGHAFCDSCIVKHMQMKNQCPLCRSYFTIIYVFLTIPKERLIEIYKEIYPNGERIYYTQQTVGERLHPDGYLLDEQDITMENQRNTKYDILSVFITCVTIYYIMYCLYKIQVYDYTNFHYESL